MIDTSPQTCKVVTGVASRAQLARYTAGAHACSPPGKFSLVEPFCEWVKTTFSSLVFGWRARAQLLCDVTLTPSEPTQAKPKIDTDGCIEMTSFQINQHNMMEFPSAAQPPKLPRTYSVSYTSILHFRRSKYVGIPKASTCKYMPSDQPHKPHEPHKLLERFCCDTSPSSKHCETALFLPSSACSPVIPIVPLAFLVKKSFTREHHKKLARAYHTPTRNEVRLSRTNAEILTSGITCRFTQFQSVVPPRSWNFHSVHSWLLGAIFFAPFEPTVS